MKRHVLAVAFCAAVLPTAAFPETLDQIAYNAVWDRFEKALKANLAEGEILQILNYPVPVAWGQNKDAGSWQLQNIAGIIPKATFALDASLSDKRLHDTFAAIAADVLLPELSTGDQAKLDAARTAYDAKVRAFRDALGDYNKQWDLEIKKLQARGETYGSAENLRIRNGLAYMITSQVSAMQEAATKVRNLSAPNRLYAAMLHDVDKAIAGVASDPVTNGLWPYEPDQAVMDAVTGTTCVPGGAGWETLAFSKSITAQSERTGSWNGNGSWNAGFFSISAGGGGSNYEKVITRDSDSVSLNFCALTYVDIKPGTWFSMDLLEAIDRGELKIKTGSSKQHKRMLGPTGEIPRLVKGLIVARTIRFQASLEQSRLDETKREIGGSGGFSLGPFTIGGGGGHTEYSKVETDQQGTYARSTNYAVPVVLAVITEPTKSPAADTAEERKPMMR